MVSKRVQNIINKVSTPIPKTPNPLVLGNLDIQKIANLFYEIQFSQEEVVSEIAKEALNYIYKQKLDNLSIPTMDCGVIKNDRVLYLSKAIKEYCKEKDFWRTLEGYATSILKELNHV